MSPEGVYAARTRVPVAQTRAELERTLERYGATAFAYGQEGERAVVAFAAGDRRARLELDLSGLSEQKVRQRWRALLLVTKARLEAVASGLQTLEEAFLADVILPDGSRVGEWARPQLEEVYATGHMPSLIPGAGAGALPRGGAG